MRKPKMPLTFDETAPERGKCVWCGENLKRNKDGSISKVRRWHETCAVDHAIVKNPNAARVHVFLRDMGVCATTRQYCGPTRTRPLKDLSYEDALEFWKQIGNESKILELPQKYEKWGCRVTNFYRKLWKECRFRGTRLKLGSWELDHIVPLWSIQNLPVSERQIYYSISNMQTLSPEAHKKKTVEEAVERAELKRVFK